MSYRIRVAFSMYDEDPTTTQPTVVSAYDEYTEEEWGKEPEFYTEAVQKAGGREKVRELDIHLAQSHIDALFAVPTVTVPTHQVDGVPA